jgi:hypothetical protein
MTIRIVTQDLDKLGRKFSARIVRYSEKHIKATQYAAAKTAVEIEDKGRANIAQAGNFSSRRWQDGFRALVSYTSRIDIRIRITHAVKYWRIFQYGGVIRGKPLLWIPLSFARDAQGVRARDYPGRLFRVDRKVGKPLLMAEGGVPKYFGTPSVRIPKKFRLYEIAKEESRNMGRYFREAMRG